MIVTAYKTVVHAQMDTVWNLLLDRIEHPEHYDRRVQESHILERFPRGVVRELRMPDGLVRERLNWDDGAWAVQSELLEHPFYTGTTVVRLLGTSVQNPMAPLHLDVNLKLEVKDERPSGLVKPEDELERAIQEEMDFIKRKAEEDEKRIL